MDSRHVESNQIAIIIIIIIIIMLQEPCPPQFTGLKTNLVKMSNFRHVCDMSGKTASGATRAQRHPINFWGPATNWRWAFASEAEK